ncbi:hypothetical protein PV08_02374 [Exophiala spinifera]|uniref:Xylanolytic transcriptional activator regulatory domain-containing protein n=1 Tax=Exophiala spinifera TaxID=91928 RepID=A0A0D1ZZG5_9EURO|nr:uncharacterized protein PV08_02374 [Exophiala spinifera]KIW18087.1 hypothetical protein PV08_02374 [Exophiala spinifera]
MTPNEQGRPYTSPAVKLDSSTYIQDSATIAVELEKRFPTPSLYLDSPTLPRAYAAVTAVLVVYRPVLMCKVIPNLLTERSAEYIARTRAEPLKMALEEYARGDAEQLALTRAQGPLEDLAALVKERGGPFVMGTTPSYGDFVIASFLYYIRRVDQDIYDGMVAVDTALSGLFEAYDGWLVSFVNDLETRVEWLESIIRKNLPSIDLNRVPNDRSVGTKNEASREADWPHSRQENDVHSDSPREDDALREIVDQVGLVSVSTGADLRYLGPSSGIFFTKFVLAGLGRRIPAEELPLSHSMDDGGDEPPVPTDLLVVEPRGLPSDYKHARWLSDAYFRTVHLQFPFLHEPTHLKTIQSMYDGSDVGSVSEFQVFMVLAIGATLLSRRAKVQLSAEGYCASAMSRLDSILQRASLQGAQCILLLEMYTIHNASSGLSLWTLHHHCLATVIELGMQRDVQGSVFSFFEQQMRTRIFWCTYTVDRTLSTLMGRPVGLMDEQCELRLPLDVDDIDLESDHPKSRLAGEPLTKMSSAVHLFRLARFNSEIKCVLYCVDRLYPPYTTPAITNVEIPRHDPDGSSQLCRADILCEIKYHELVMLVLRPSPLFQHPSKASIRECFSSATTCCLLYHNLYTTGSLQYSWISVQSLFLCVITMFYCVWTPDGVADEVDLDALTRALRAASDVLSATGEYWPEAKRSRDVLDRISTTTMHRFTREFNKSPNSHRGLLGVQSLASTSSALGREQPDPLDLSHAPHDLPGFSLEDDGNTGYGDTFSPFLSEPADSFTSADVLSYFMSSEGNVNPTDVEMYGEGYPSTDEVLRGFFEDGLRDYRRGL